MSLSDPVERTRIGIRQQTELLGAAPKEPSTPFEASLRDYVFAEVWTRPGLDRRSRFLITIASAIYTTCPSEMLDDYIRGAIICKEVTLAELREGALHVAVYGGWSRGAIFDAAVTRVANALNLPPAACPPIRAEPWDPEKRLAEGAANFQAVMVSPGPPPVTAYYEAGILNFVFGEMWMRPGLDQRARRWLTLVCVAESTTDIPVRSHVHAAMASGNATLAEMHEFVLQYAIHGSWPKASVIQGAVIEMGERVKKGLPFT